MKNSFVGETVLHRSLGHVSPGHWLAGFHITILRSNANANACVYPKTSGKMSTYEELLLQMLADPPSKYEPLPLSNRRETMLGATFAFLVRFPNPFFFMLQELIVYIDCGMVCSYLSSLGSLQSRQRDGIG